MKREEYTVSGNARYDFWTRAGPATSAIAGAQVTVTNIDTNVSVPTVTNATGYYEARLLLPGNYQVSAQASGFKKSVRGKGSCCPSRTSRKSTPLSSLVR